MKSKVLKLIKKISALMLAVFLCTESFAAIVSDNDGSAFITKAEFDSLKNNFQSQIDKYNTSMDAKIDGAIAAYLAGIKVDKSIISNVINNQWNDVSAINGGLENDYLLPTIDFLFTWQYSYSANGISDNGGKQDLFNGPSDGGGRIENQKVLLHFARRTYNTDLTTQNQHRCLVKCTGDDDDFGDFIWDGRALKYRESIVAVKSVVSWLQDDVSADSLPYFDRPDSRNFSITLQNLTTFKPVGKISNWNSVANTYWPTRYIWKHGAKSGGSISTNEINFKSGDTNNIFSSTISLEKDASGNTKDFEHIISYNGDNELEVSDQSMNMRFRQSSKNPYTAAQLETNATKVDTNRGVSLWAGSFGNWASLTEEQYKDKTASRGSLHNYYGVIPIALETQDNATISSIGMLPNDVATKDIYQDNIEKEIDVNGLKVIKERPKLNDGFQLLAAKETDKITWEPVFNYTHVHNGATTYTDNTHEVDIYFSNGPFEDNVSSANLIKVKVNGASTESNYATTSGRRCKVEFEMPHDGIVYVKWVPHDAGAYLNSDWIVTLDLKNCNTYTYIRE